jgi:hypothetical protein
MATVTPKLKSQTSGISPVAKANVKSSDSHQDFILAEKPSEDWQEKAADQLVKSADWLAGATSRLSQKIATAAHDNTLRDRAIKVVGVATSAGGLIASQASKVNIPAAYRYSADFARRNPKTAAIGGVAAAAAVYGLYRRRRNGKVNQSTDIGSVHN